MQGGQYSQTLLGWKWLYVIGDTFACEDFNPELGGGGGGG